MSLCHPVLLVGEVQRPMYLAHLAVGRTQQTCCWPKEKKCCAAARSHRRPAVVMLDEVLADVVEHSMAELAGPSGKMLPRKLAMVQPGSDSWGPDTSIAEDGVLQTRRAAVPYERCWLD